MTEPLIDDVLRSLLTASRKAEPNLARAYALWLGVEAELPVMRESQTWSDYRDVAALGFRLAASPNPDDALFEGFTAGLAWMRGRAFFVANRAPSFELDGLANLGVAVGIRCLAEDQAAVAAKWLGALVDRAVAEFHQDSWDRGLAEAARFALLGDLEAWRVLVSMAPDLAAAVASVLKVPEASGFEAGATATIMSAIGGGRPVERTITMAAGLRYLLRTAPTVVPDRITTAGLAKLLSFVGHSLKRWPWEFEGRTPKSTPQRWDIQNEYHVQSLLWAVLAPILPADLDDEEWLRSIAEKRPRADLLIPSMNLVIELKFLRETTTSALNNLVDGIASDSAVYLADPRVRDLIVFIWDAANASAHHQELKAGLQRLAGVRHVIIVTRPGGWQAQPRARPSRGSPSGKGRTRAAP